MGRYRIRDDAPPWSFFLPVTLAVIVGVLVAGWIQRAIDHVFAKEEVPSASAAVQHALPPPPLMEAPAIPPVSSAPERDPSMDAPAPPSVYEPSVELPEEPATGGTATPASEAAAAEVSADTPRLPGALVARREGLQHACINGTIAERSPNGWQQRLENDAPVACVESSTTR